MSDSAIQTDAMILIRKVLDRVAIDGALTEDAAKYFHKALRENKEMREEIKILTGKVNARDEKIKGVEQSNTDLTTENRIYKTREEDIIAREEQMVFLELTAKYEKERVDDHKEMLSIIFSGILGHVEQDDKITETE